MSAVYAGLEAGGSKFICAVGRSPDRISAETSFPTGVPAETLGRAIAFFAEQRKYLPLAAIGIGSFGPLDLRPNSPTYGYITSTPKPGWAQTDLVGALQRTLDLPVAFDTDVNTAALGEHRWGAAQEVDDFIYLTVGTGIGGGGMVEGRLLHGLLHPEMGHIHVPHDLSADPYRGCCPHHGDCLEGLASGPALAGRWGRSPGALPPDHPAWELEAHYLGLALVNYIYTLSPQRIVLGGGVMAQAQLFPLIRQKVQALLNGYLQATEILAEIDQYIVPPDLGRRAGVLGAIALAERLASDG